MNLAPPEIITILVFLLVIVFALTFVLTRAARTGRKQDLATRVRGLKQVGRTEQAVHLVRGETGMNQADAEKFVHDL